MSPWEKASKIQCQIKHYNEDKSNLTTCINSSMLTDLSMTFHDAALKYHAKRSSSKAWASGSYKHEYCRGSPVSNTPLTGLGYRTAATVLILVTP